MGSSLTPLPTLPDISSYVENSQSSYSMNLTPQELSDANLASNTYLGTSLPTSTYNVTPIVGASSSPTQKANLSLPSTSSTVGSNLSNAAKNILSFSSISLEDWIFILLGLLLIAAGIFAFKSTQTIIEKAGNISSKVAKASAEAA